MKGTRSLSFVFSLTKLLWTKAFIKRPKCKYFPSHLYEAAAHLRAGSTNDSSGSGHAAERAAMSSGFRPAVTVHSAHRRHAAAESSEGKKTPDIRRFGVSVCDPAARLTS